MKLIFKDNQDNKGGYRISLLHYIYFDEQWPKEGFFRNMSNLLSEQRLEKDWGRMIFCVCEDEERQLNYLTGLLEKLTKHGDHLYIKFDTPQKLMSYAQYHHIDVLVMDINLGMDNGIEWVNKIHDFQWQIPVIFVTGDERHRWSVYEASHVYSLKKPVNENDLVKAVNKALDAATWRNREMKSRGLMVRSREIQTFAGFHEIIYMESDKRKLKIYCKDELMVNGNSADRTKRQGFAGSREPLVTYANIKETLDKLDKRFNHCHKSYIVNMEFIRELDRPRFIYKLKNGMEIPISQSKSRDSIERFFDYIGGKGQNQFGS